MATGQFSSALDPLFAYLDGLTGRAEVKDLDRCLKSLSITVDDVANFVRFGEDCYLRNLIKEGEHYHALALCWRSGQRSPIHNHAGSTCGLRVLSGVATETVFVKTPSLLMKATTSVDCNAGEVSTSADSFVHQVSNLQSPGVDLVTLHIYSPPLLKMDTFSLTDSHVGEFRPMVLEHALGSGI
jgi:cysteine dioxygenase